jgi:hypothetical protein
VSEERRGVILYGSGVDAVAEALRKLDPRYVLADHVTPESGLVPVLRCPQGAEADAVRAAVPDVAWLVVELYRPGVAVEHAGDPLLVLNAAKVDPGTAARAIHQPDLVIWYEVINPVRVTTVDGGPAADDYSNIVVIVPDGHRMVAHAVNAGGVAPHCLPGDADQVLRSHDLWVLARSRKIEVCQACALRHRDTTTAAGEATTPIKADHAPDRSKLGPKG